MLTVIVDFLLKLIRVANCGSDVSCDLFSHLHRELARIQYNGRWGSSGKNDLNTIRQVEVQAVCFPSITCLSRNMDWQTPYIPYQWVCLNSGSQSVVWNFDSVSYFWMRNVQCFVPLSPPPSLILCRFSRNGSLLSFLLPAGSHLL